MQHPTRQAQAAFVVALLAAAPARADDPRAVERPADEVVVGGRTLTGAVRIDDDGVAVERDGWTVRVPHDQALAIRRRGGGVDAHAASRLEEQGLVHELRGRLPLALDAYAAANPEAIVAPFAQPACGGCPADRTCRSEFFLIAVRRQAVLTSRPSCRSRSRRTRRAMRSRVMPRRSTRSSRTRSKSTRRSRRRRSRP